jgi:voltage-gated potassium channel
MERYDQRSTLRGSLRAAIAFLFLLGIGVAGFHFLEGFDLVDSLYMTVITITTVGFGEVHSLSPIGRLFTIALILGGAGIAAYSVSIGAEYLASGQWRWQWTQRRNRQMLAALKDHIIVCGFGRVGRFVAQDLKAEGIPFMVIEKEPERVSLAQRCGYLALQGNAANENLLDQSGIRRARGLVAAVDSDAENVYIVLTARGLKPDLQIIARANFEESESKLIRAGANRVLLPYRISGRRMATMLLRPEVADFLDEVTRAGGIELLLEQIAVRGGSALEGLTLAEARTQLQLDITVLAYKNPGSSLNLRPGPDTVLAAGMQILALGTGEELRRLIQAAEGKQDSATGVFPPRTS